MTKSKYRFVGTTGANMGKDIYDKINQTGGIKNPVEGATNSVNSAIGNVGSKIDNKINDIMGSINPDQRVIDKLNKAKSVLSSAKGVMGDFSSHTNDTMDNYYQVMSAAKSFAGSIDGSDGCQSYLGVLGSISSVGNMALGRLNEAIRLLETCLNTVENILANIDQIMDRIKNIANEIKTMILNEVANLAKYLQELWKLSLSSALSYLFDDPCLSGIISDSLDSEVIDMIN